MILSAPDSKCGSLVIPQLAKATFEAGEFAKHAPTGKPC
jgi:hypothetical protein